MDEEADVRQVPAKRSRAWGGGSHRHPRTPPLGSPGSLSSPLQLTAHGSSPLRYEQASQTFPVQNEDPPFPPPALLLAGPVTEENSGTRSPQRCGV